MARLMDNPERKKQATQLLSKGKKQADVARELGVSTPTVCRFAKREDVREMITQEAQRFAELLPDAVTMTRDLIDAG